MILPIAILVIPQSQWHCRIHVYFISQIDVTPCPWVAYYQDERDAYLYFFWDHFVQVDPCISINVLVCFMCISMTVYTTTNLCDVSFHKTTIVT